MKTGKIIAVLMIFVFMIPMASATVGDLIVTLGQQAVISSTPAISQVYSAVQLAEQATTLAAAVSGGPASIAALGGQFALSQIKAEGMSAILGSQAAGQISQIENYGKILAQGSGFNNVKINKERGFIEEGTMTIKSEDGTEKNINMKNLKFAFDEKTKTGKYTFGESSSLEIGDRKYENIESGGVIETDNKGSVVSADITSTKETSYTFGNNEPVKVPANSNVIFKNGQLTIDSGLKDVEYLGKKLNGNFHEINIFGNEITGETLLVGGIETTYPVVIDGKEIIGKLSIKNNGLLLYENSKLIDEANSIEVSTESSEILYADSGKFTKESAKAYGGDIIWQSESDAIIKSQKDFVIVDFTHKEGKKEVFVDKESKAWVSSVEAEFKAEKGKLTQIRTHQKKTPEQIIKELQEGKKGLIMFEGVGITNQDYANVGEVETNYYKCSNEKGAGIIGKVIAAITGQGIKEKYAECIARVKTAISKIGSRVEEIGGKLYITPKGNTEKVEVDKIDDNLYVSKPLFLKDYKEEDVTSYKYKYYYDKKGNRLDNYEVMDMRNQDAGWVKKSFEGIIVETTATVITEPVAPTTIRVEIARMVGALGGKANLETLRKETRYSVLLDFTLSEAEESLILKAARGVVLTQKEISALNEGKISEFLKKKGYVVNPKK